VAMGGVKKDRSRVGQDSQTAYAPNVTQERIDARPMTSVTRSVSNVISRNCSAPSCAISTIWESVRY